MTEIEKLIESPNKNIITIIDPVDFDMIQGKAINSDFGMLFFSHKKETRDYFANKIIDCLEEKFPNSTFPLVIHLEQIKEEMIKIGNTKLQRTEDLFKIFDMYINLLYLTCIFQEKDYFQAYLNSEDPVKINRYIFYIGTKDFTNEEILERFGKVIDLWIKRIIRGKNKSIIMFDWLEDK